MDDYELRSKPKRCKTLGNHEGDIRINELRYQAFVNPIFSAPPPSSTDVSYDDGGCERRSVLRPRARMLHDAMGDSNQTSTVLPEFAQPLIIGNTQHISESPCTVFSPRLYDDSQSRVSMFVEVEKLRRPTHSSFLCNSCDGQPK